MHKNVRPLIKALLFPLGVAFLFVMWWPQEGMVFSVASAATIIPTPTVDRLAKPTLPASPSQADMGSQVFWLYCLPCHGDKGQGLTDEFRQVYPPDHQNCWASGCHGKRPYPNGWTLPTVVPRLIGDGALNNFADAASLHAFISTNMPFQAPGTLDDKLYWQVTAFLLRQNGLWNGQGEVNASNAAEIIISKNAAPVPTSTPSPVPSTQNGSSDSIFFVGVGIVVLVFFVIIILQFKTRKKLQ